jgi:hypothetical protein
MTSLGLGINGARSEQVTPALPPYDLYETSGGAGADFAVMRRADGAWRDRRNCESGPRVPAVTPKFHRTSFYNFFFFR